MAKRRTPYDDLFAAAERRYGIPADVLAGQDFVESSMNPNANSGVARGISQFTAPTAKTYGVQYGSSPGAVRSQIFGQAHYLSDLGYKKNPKLALSGYNAGPGNPGAAGDYAQRVLAAARKYSGLGGAQLPRSPASMGVPGPGRSPSPEPGSNIFSTLSNIGVRGGLYEEDDPIAENWRLLGAIRDLNQQKGAPVGQTPDTRPVPLRGGAGAVAARASAIDREHLPYQWGGGHGATPAKPGVPLDCSGAVARALGVDPRVSGQFAKWGQSGKGKFVTIYANNEHVLMEINGRFWGTSASNPGGGAGWIPRSAISPAYLKRFAVRHPPGM